MAVLCTRKSPPPAPGHAAAAGVEGTAPRARTQVKSTGPDGRPSSPASASHDRRPPALNRILVVLRDISVGAPATSREAATSSLRRMVAAGPIVAFVSMVAALIATGAAGIPLRDPDHVAGRRLVMLLALVALLVAARRRRPREPPRARARARRARSSRSVRRERWTWRRGVVVGTALVSFYASYFAYRNLKSVVPLLRPERAVRPPAGRLGPGAVRRQRPGRAAPHAARDRRREPRALRRVPAAVRLHPGDARGGARVLAEPPGRPVLRERAVAELAARRRELLPAAVARADLHRPGRLREPAGHRRVASCRCCCSTSASTSCATRRSATAQSIARVRLAARLDLLHRRARGAPARPRRGRCGSRRGCWSP